MAQSQQSLPDTIGDLPILAHTEKIASALQSGDVLLRAEAGAGKSTALPLALLLHANLNGKILLLEPRRLAARMVAERLAYHLGERVGQRIGLRMRGDTRTSKQTVLEIITDGVLTRLLQQDPTLEGVALVIFDEFHERSLQADLGLTLCLEVQQALRDDLRLLLMSATLDTVQLPDVLHNSQRIDCTVRQHSVSIRWQGESRQPLPQQVASTVLTALQEQPGDILVFLPGVAEINRTARLLEAHVTRDQSIHRLHSGTTNAAQKKATEPGMADHRRIILATSLAETSITIDGVRVVIDSGRERRGRMDNTLGAQRLETVTASQASATQRAGRAGRTSDGTCYRLWNEAGHSRRATHWQPEILRADLAPLLLELYQWGTSAESLPWIDAPPAASLSRATDLLVHLGVLNEGQLTVHGRQVAKLPLHPRLAHMVLWAHACGVAQLGCQMAVQLEDRSIRQQQVDMEAMLTATLASAAQRRIAQLEKVLPASLTAIQGSSPSPAILLAQAYPDWIAKRRTGNDGLFRLACGAGAMIDSEDSLAHSTWLAVAQLGGSGTQARLFQAMAIDIDELRAHAPELFTQTDAIEWDDKADRVVAERRVLIGQLQVHAQRIEHIDATDKAAALLVGIRQHGLTCLPWNDACREWQARASRMKNVVTDKPWPDVDDLALLQTVDEWLLPWLQGHGTLKALQQLDLLKILRSLLNYQQHTLLDEWLPTHFTVPSGSAIRLNYTQPGNPVLSVRLQEMLGCAASPTIAHGRIPLKVELLSPARRPVQVTEDLANFWTTSYADVKKDMAGRYPKHVWPDDPLTATPTTRAKPRKR